MMKRVVVMIIKGALLLSGLLLLSVTTPSATYTRSNVDSTDLVNIRSHNTRTLRAIEYEIRDKKLN